MKQAIIVVDLGFGDAGKGTMIDALAKEHPSSRTVVRFNGGCQAAHHVVHDDGTSHTFSQFGSATFRGLRTHLTRDVLFQPIVAKMEAEVLTEKLGFDPMVLLTVHKDAKVTTNLHGYINRLREANRGDDKHGSCGYGIGETMSWNLTNPELTIYASDLVNVDLIYRKLKMMAKHLINVILNEAWHHSTVELRENIISLCNDDSLHQIAQAMIICQDNVVDNDFEKSLLARDGVLLLEGAQGVLLDEHYGFHPHTTWSTTTFDNALNFLKYYDGEVLKLGVTRAYTTRHGNGPFPTYSEELTKSVQDDTNPWNANQGAFKVGKLDLVLLKYAVKIAKPDMLAVTCLDRHVNGKFEVNMDYQLVNTKEVIADITTAKPTASLFNGMLPGSCVSLKMEVLPNWLSEQLQLPIYATSFGKQAIHKKFNKMCVQMPQI